ncbi:MAG: YbjN domain-containing protein [Actinomycetes bacterium]
MRHRTKAELDDVIRQTLADRELEFERVSEGTYFVPLKGEHKQQTMTWLVVGDHSLLVEAFFVRRPDENEGEFYKFLLGRNGRMYGMAFSADQLGDVFIVGHLPLSAVTPDEIDRLLGCMLTYADENFDRALELGFATSIRKEWAWRLSRGESTANLRAFARFAEPAP